MKVRIRHVIVIVVAVAALHLLSLPQTAVRECKLVHTYTAQQALAQIFTAADSPSASSASLERAMDEECNGSMALTYLVFTALCVRAVVAVDARTSATRIR